jgi:hypothetical protein
VSEDELEELQVAVLLELRERGAKRSVQELSRSEELAEGSVRALDDQISAAEERYEAGRVLEQLGEARGVEQRLGGELAWFRFDQGTENIGSGLRCGNSAKSVAKRNGEARFAAHSAARRGNDPRSLVSFRAGPGSGNTSSGRVRHARSPPAATAQPRATASRTQAPASPASRAPSGDSDAHQRVTDIVSGERPSDSSANDAFVAELEGIGWFAS